MARILVVEDDPKNADQITAALNDYGYETDAITTGAEALRKATSETYGAIVLDRMLPGRLDGLTVLATLRAADIHTPVLILSALSAVDERIRGLKSGGDDYLVKPFEALELVARLNALMRPRHLPEQTTTLRVGSLEVNLLTHGVRRDGTLIELLPREYRILEYLIRHRGQIVTRAMLFEEIWHYHYDKASNVLDVHISRLRRKVDAEGLPTIIKTVRGIGYLLDDDA
ncbi:two component transcriptional regulator, winged helix family [Arboricoccus pini]|uniref:Two component transcriptional regulator, winged helix family n=1 Tax=Arboricoccus pini TaxID=1963835 RepID=A0A212R3K7_9PROT|nr:response regulator transcription factor [Arboricoccus pini]SNB66624.1 two component transcriptional regulator, winged helix family [Arboricoccus pini]